MDEAALAWADGLVLVHVFLEEFVERR